MPKAPKKQSDDQRTEAETVKVRDATLKRMLTTKPRPHRKASDQGAKRAK